MLTASGYKYDLLTIESKRICNVDNLFSVSLSIVDPLFGCYTFCGKKEAQEKSQDLGTHFQSRQLCFQYSLMTQRRIEATKHVSMPIRSDLSRQRRMKQQDVKPLERVCALRYNLFCCLSAFCNTICLSRQQFFTHR